jgi:starch-binding outer membrane protein, SusD/RagB family
MNGIMKKYLVYFIIISACFLTACDDFLTPDPTDKYPESVAFSSVEHTKLYVNSFYPILKDYGLFGGKYLGGCLYVDGLTDIEKTAGSTIGINGAVANIYATEPSQITIDQNSLGIWADAYASIRLLNEFLDGIDKNATYSDTYKNQFKGEVHFLRGYLYFLLMRNHGSVILLSNLTTEKNNARSEASDCWDFIASDFDYAAENLPSEWSSDDAGRITSGAAYAMKSRAMLYAERWQEAYDAANKVMELKTQGIYKLNDNYADAFGSYTNDGNKESILEYNYSYPLLVHYYDNLVSPGGDNPGFGGDIQPTQELVESYEYAGGGTVDWSAWHKTGATTTPPWASLEPRFQATVLYNGETWKGRTIQTYEGGKDGWIAYPPVTGGNLGYSVTGYYCRKNVDETHTDLVNVESSQTMVEMRLAEVYLNLAEAAYQLGKTGEANDAVNAVRNRVGLPDVSLTGTTLYAQIKTERKLELAMEGQRYWDIRRWKDAVSVLNGLYVHGIKPVLGDSGLTYDYITCDDAPRQFPEKFYAFGIPSSELLNNTACRQITGW